MGNMKMDEMKVNHSPINESTNSKSDPNEANLSTILVIEDDRAIRGAIVDILETEGYHVISAEDGALGVERALQAPPSLIICDIMMPYLDGYGVLTELRKHAETAIIPFIFLTARTTQDDVRQGMNLGADDYLTKPFRADVLLQAIQTRLDRHARLTEKFQNRVNLLTKNLLSVLPHELNTPLHGILAGVEFLKDEYETLEPSDVQELLWIIHQSALRMRRLVGNSLLHADLESIDHSNSHHRKATSPSLNATAPIITQIANQEVNAAARAADLHMELTDVTISIVPAHLSKIVEELLNNACKYSKPGTPIEVTSGCGENNFWLTVKDQGRGIRSEEIATISAYRQFQRSHYEQQGLGLGLAIIQRLLELYQGTFTIVSVPGEYTKMHINLPLAPTDAAS